MPRLSAHGSISACIWMSRSCRVVCSCIHVSTGLWERWQVTRIITDLQIHHAGCCVPDWGIAVQTFGGHNIKRGRKKCSSANPELRTLLTFLQSKLLFSCDRGGSMIHKCDFLRHHDGHVMNESPPSATQKLCNASDRLKQMMGRQATFMGVHSPRALEVELRCRSSAACMPTQRWRPPGSSPGPAACANGQIPSSAKRRRRPWTLSSRTWSRGLPARTCPRPCPGCTGT